MRAQFRTPLTTLEYQSTILSKGFEESPQLVLDYAERHQYLGHTIHNFPSLKENLRRPRTRKCHEILWTIHPRIVVFYGL